VSVDLRNKLGESLSTIQKFDTPLEQATTPSLEALKAFSSGIQTISTKGSDAAIPFFKHAIELDPNFALAYSYLGIMENDILETSLAVEYHEKPMNCATGPVRRRGMRSPQLTIKKSPEISKRPWKPASFGYRLIHGRPIRTSFWREQFCRSLDKLREQRKKPPRQFV
jgi:hypothetical protein